MYKEYSRNTLHPYKASFPPLVSKSTTFQESSYPGKHPQAASSRCSRKSRPSVPSSKHENAAKPKHSSERKETCRRRNYNISGRRVGPLDGTPHDGGHPYFPHSSAECQDDQYPIQLSETDVNILDACNEYGYDPPYVTESFQQAPGSPYYQNCPLTLDEDEVIDGAVYAQLRRGRHRANQPPAPPRSLRRRQPLPFPPPARSCKDVPGDDATRTSTAGSALASHQVKDEALAPPPTSSNLCVGGGKSASYRNALSGPFRVLFHWGFQILDWARSINKHTRRGSGTPVRDVHIACPEECERRHEGESESQSECVPDSWPASCIGSEDEDAESEVEAALCTPPLLSTRRRLEMEVELDSCCVRASRTCEEHLHLDLEAHEYETLLEDYLDTPNYSYGRTVPPRSDRRMFSGSPSLPHAILGSLSAETFRLISTPHDYRPIVPPPDLAHALDDEGNIKLTRIDASDEALLSNHMHPRWRHYRFAAHGVAGGEIVYEDKVPVSYLDEGLVEMERLREMSAKGRLRVKWGVVDKNKLSWV